MKKVMFLLMSIMIFTGCGEAEFDSTRQDAIDEGVTIVHVPAGDGIVAEVDCWSNNVSTWYTIDTSQVTGGFSYCQIRVSHVAAYGTNSNSYNFRTKGQSEYNTISVAPNSQVFDIWTDENGLIEWRHGSAVTWSQRVTMRIEVINFLF